MSKPPNTTDFTRVQEFHRKFKLPDGHQDEDYIIDGLSMGAMHFRAGFLREEVTEFVEASHAGNRVEAFDALLDLVYVAYGTAMMMGITEGQWDRGFRIVHNCNMRKERATSVEQSKRGSSLDVIKPEGWLGPESTLKVILEKGTCE